ncbi:vomeronasal type-1 receptor 2-like [Dasypus novemcinctus]|uniref:vomeronasal type-1 receptor 2-like n=1 Tax=Dasypus novemcinctus TaxID=9361 RepID=UPI0003292669|nr:vomeronasal type-1 receptor 2-like [Dasypus novemcinctus]
MADEGLKIGMLFLFQIVIGILGNFSLLFGYIFLYFSGCRLSATNVIIRHLSVANILAILSRGIPGTMAAFQMEHLLDYIGCQLVSYVQRVGRGVSIGTTCLLSVFQAIIISPGNSRWAELKRKARKYTGSSIVLCWILHIVINMIFPVYVSSKWSNKNTTWKNVLEYCPAIGNTVESSLNVTVLSFHDGLCLGLMVLASGAIVFILYRHKQQVQYIHRNNLSPRSSHENRATRSILAMVSSFVALYALSYIIYVYMALCENPIMWLANTCALINACFPTISPFILMSQDSVASRLCSVCYGRNAHFPRFIRKYKFSVLHHVQSWMISSLTES